MIDLSDKTIYQILNESLHPPPPPEHHKHMSFPPPPIRTFAKILNFTQNTELFNLLDDENKSFSLLAPDDRALKRFAPPHQHDHEHPPPPSDQPALSVTEDEERNAFWNSPLFRGTDDNDAFEPHEILAFQSPFDIGDLISQIFQPENKISKLTDHHNDDRRTHLRSLV